MSAKKSMFLEIVSGLHAFVMCMGVYPLLASLCELEGMVFAQFCGEGILLLAPIFVSRILLRKVKNMILYLLSGVIVSVLVGQIAFGFGTFAGYGAGLLGVLTGVLSFVVFLVHTYAKITYGRMKRAFQAMPGGNENFELREWEIPTIFSTPDKMHWLWFTLLYLCGLFVRSAICLRVVFYLALADIFLCFLYQYSYEFYRYIRENQRIANLPVKTMRRIHKVIGAMAVLLLILFVLPAVWYGKEPLEHFHFEWKNAEKGESQEIVLPPEMGGEQEIFEEEEEEEEIPVILPGWIRRLLSTFLSLVLIAFILFALRMIYQAIQNAGKLFSVEEDDEVVFLNAKDAGEPLDAGREKQTRDGWLSEKARIRRRYKKVILKGTRGRPKRWATPTELEEQARLAREEVQGLHEAYEKARYGDIKSGGNNT